MLSFKAFREGVDTTLDEISKEIPNYSYPSKFAEIRFKLHALQKLFINFRKNTSDSRAIQMIDDRLSKIDNLLWYVDRRTGVEE